MTFSSTDPTIASQVEATFSKSRLRNLIVDAGIASRTLAALLRRNGEFLAVHLYSVKSLVHDISEIIDAN